MHDTIGSRFSEFQAPARGLEGQTTSAKTHSLAFGARIIRTAPQRCPSRPRGLWLTLFLLIVMTVPCAVAQQATPIPEDNPDPLAAKEAMIRDRFQRFEDRVFRLREQLSEVEPDNAARLARVLESAGEYELSDRLDQLTEMLKDSARRNEALDAQAQWVGDAERVLGILMERDSGNDLRKDEIDRLQAYLESLDDILKEQRALRQSSAQATLAKRMAQQLDQAIQRIQAMLDDQDALMGKPSDEDAQRKQQDLQRDAEDLAEQLKRIAQEQPDEGADSEALKAARAKSSQASESTKKGADSMSQAGEAMKQGAAPGSQQSQAKEDLEQAKKKLEEAKRALEEEFDLDDMAEQQGDVAKQTKELAEKMKQEGNPQGGDPQGGGKEGGGQGEGQGESPPQGEQESPPGEQGLQQAQEHMDKAQSELGEKNPDQAVPEQDQAIEKLEQAQKELEELLQQLRQEERAETLRDLEVRFREMLAKQRSINTETIPLHELGRDSFRRAEELKLADLSANERALSVDAATCLHILEEDATTVVFPRVVEQISKDMATVSDRLAALYVAALTQQIQAEIVEALEQLLDAVQQMQEENEQKQGGKPGSGSKDEGLLPTSAELKLLRSSQVRVNTRTKTIESAKRDVFGSPEDLAGASKDVSVRQKELARIAIDMRDLQDRP